MNLFWNRFFLFLFDSSRNSFRRFLCQTIKITFRNITHHEFQVIFKKIDEGRTQLQCFMVS